jgi:hypothetical protein
VFRCEIEDEVALKFYRLQRISEGGVDLSPGEAEPLKGPTEVGTGKYEDKTIVLSQLIDTINDRFGTDFKPPISFSSIRLQKRLLLTTRSKRRNIRPDYAGWCISRRGFCALSTRSLRPAARAGKRANRARPDERGVIRLWRSTNHGHSNAKSQYRAFDPWGTSRMAVGLIALGNFF